MELSKTANCLTINRNYRSYESIISVANSIICNNRYRFDKQLRAVKEGGEKVVYNCTSSDLDEGRFVADTIEKESAKGRKYSDFTVLYRTNAQSRIFEENLMRRGIPYKLVGSLRFYERQEIKDMLAYLRFIANPEDSVSLRRIINLPKRGIGQTTIDTIEQLAGVTGQSMFNIIENCENFESIKRARNGLSSFAEIIRKFMDYSEENPASALISYISQTVDLSSEYMKEGEDVCASRMENIGQLVNMATELEQENTDTSYTLSDFLERMALVSGIDEMESEDSVTLMTVHTSKGLEFPVVFVVGLEETLFPSIRNFTEDEKEIEEERRLCYVAVTRACEKLYLTCANRRMTYGKTSFNPVSRFIKEIPMDLLEDISEASSRNNSYYDEYIDSSISRLEKQSGVSFESFVKKNYSSAPKTVKEIKSFVQQEAHSGESFRQGDKVSHKKFGNGTVVNVTTNGDLTVLAVDFDNFGRKNIISTVVTKL